MMITSRQFFNYIKLNTFYSKGLAIWHSFSAITHIIANNGVKSAILNLIALRFYFSAYPIRNGSNHTFCFIFNG